MKNEPTILIYSPNDADIYARLLQKKGYTKVSWASTPEEAKKRLPDTEVLVCWNFPLYLLSSPEASKLNWIQSLGAGIDDLMKSKHIPEQVMVTRVVDQFGIPISEYVFAYLLYVNKNISKAEAQQQEKKWTPFITETLAGKTIGVAGLGSIGKEIVKKARAFNMLVYGLSFSGAQSNLVDRHFRADQWLSFVKELDYLVLTLPLTEETLDVVNRELLLAMKSNATIVNVGRGKCIAEKDLIDVLNCRTFTGCCTGCFLPRATFEGEPIVEYAECLCNSTYGWPQHPRGCH